MKSIAEPLECCICGHYGLDVERVGWTATLLCEDASECLYRLKRLSDEPYYTNRLTAATKRRIDLEVELMKERGN